LPSPDWSVGSRWRALLLAALPLLGIPILLSAGDPADTAVWQAVHMTLAATLGLVIAALGCRHLTGRSRSVRGWIAFAFAAWLGVVLLRDLERSGLVPLLPSDIGLIAVAIGVLNAYRAGLRGKLNKTTEMSIYLDAAIVFVAAAAALFAILGPDVLEDAGNRIVLIRALFFLGIFASSAMLDLVFLPPFSFSGSYAMLGGLFLVGAGFIGNTELSEGHGLWPFAALISIGLIVIAFGAATWSDDEDEDPVHVRRAQRARDLFPLAAVGVIPIFLLPAQITATDLFFRLAIDSAIGFIVVGSVVRQRLLLRERDRVLESSRAALGVVERRARQLGGIEGAGRALAVSGPSPEALDAVASILAERFGYDHVAIYLGDGSPITPGADPDRPILSPGLDAATGIVGRVVRTREAAFVPDVANDPHYVAGDRVVMSEICVPLLDADRLLGVLDVQSAGPDKLDETDLAAVLAVADRVAGAVTLESNRQRLVDEKDFISAILDAVGAIVIVVGADGRVARFNDATSVVSGYSAAEIDAQGSLDFLVPSDQRPGVLSALDQIHAGETGTRRENEWVRKDGSRRHIAWSNTAVRDIDDVVRYTIATGIDITDRKNLENELAYKALHDPLTGLPNRLLLMDRLEHALRSRGGAETSLLFLDIDDFKTINDRLGHDVGDQVLKHVAERLVRAVRPGDTVSRLSGDEFAVVLEGSTDRFAPDLAAKRILALVAVPIEVREHRLALTVSIGSAVAGTDATVAGDLLRNADFAMYAAKQDGPGRYRRYAAKDRAAADDDARLEADLPGAVARGELRLHYQPIVDLPSGRIAGLEALVRWQHPERGLLAPGSFIPIAERSGSIVAIGEWVLDSACRDLRTWQLQARDLTMAVNLSGRQLESSSLFSHVRHALRRNAIAPATLILEVTETVLLADPTAVVKLEGLKALGVRLAIDDFGTGYSSISYLRRFPVDILKIDREFTDGADSPGGLKLLRGIAQLGRMVGLELIAEGIERAEQIGPIVDAGCVAGQGFLFARPVEAAAITALLAGGSLGPVSVPGRAATPVGPKRARKMVAKVATV